MGYTWEINIWKENDCPDERFSYHQFWAGDSFFEMLWRAYQAKQRTGCVQILWRG